MSKAQLKKHLNTLEKPQIIEMVMELYDARKEAKEYLEFYLNPDENKELEKFKKIRLEIPSANLFLQNTTARLTRRMLWAKHNTTPYIQTSNIDKCVRNPVETRHGTSLHTVHLNKRP